MPRRPRKPFPQRVAGSIESMIPGTVGGRVANASPVRVAPQRGRIVPPAVELPADPMADALYVGVEGRSYTVFVSGHEQTIELTTLNMRSTGGQPISYVTLDNNYSSGDPQLNKYCYIHGIKLQFMNPLNGDRAIGVASDPTLAPGDGVFTATGGLTITWSRTDSSFATTTAQNELRVTAASTPYIFVLTLHMHWADVDGIHTP